MGGLRCPVVPAGVPAAGPRASDPAGAGQQAVPPAGPGEPDRRRRSPEGPGPGREPEVGQPAEEGRRHHPPPQGETDAEGYDITAGHVIGHALSGPFSLVCFHVFFL